MSAVSARELSVASVPAAHPYVENLSTPDGGAGVVRLGDPVPAGATAGQWWPPVMLDARWVRAHAAEFDVFHVHFGVESSSLTALTELIDALREVDRPLVYTVHDLANPQLTDQSHHEAQLGILTGAASALITLTEGAADEVERRFGRRPHVIAHPHLFPLDATIPAGTRRDPYVIGVDLRDLRPNIDGERIVDCLVRAVEILRGAGVDAVGRVHLRDRVRDAGAADRIATRLAAADACDVELVRTPRLSDEDLAASIADLDVALLPYRHGTHSGWVELCWDLGVPVAGQAVGYAHEQHPDDFAAIDPTDPASLAAAILDLVSGRAARPGTGSRRILTASRRVERRFALHEAERRHRGIYDEARARVTV